MSVYQSVPEKSPLSYELVTYVWVIVLSVWGGIASYVRKLRTGVVTRFSLAEIIGDIVVSGFVGVTTFFICETYAVPQLLSAAMIGISGHMGSRAIFAMEEAMDQAFKRWASVDYVRRRRQSDRD